LPTERTFDTGTSVFPAECVAILIAERTGRTEVPAASGGSIVLWPMGLVFAEALLVAPLWIALPPVRHFRLFWIAFIFVGLITPVLCVAMRWVSPRTRLAEWLCIVALPVWLLFILVARHSADPLGFSAIETLPLLVFGFYRGLKRAEWLQAGLATVLSWAACLPLALEFSIRDALVSRSSILVNVAFFLVTVGYAWFFARHRLTRLPTGRTYVRKVSIAAVALTSTVVIGLLSFRQEFLYQTGIYFHRTFWVEPAHFVRYGDGWLLWDTSSQYGFLNILALALVPTSSTFAALYWLTAILVTIQTGALFWMLYAGRPGSPGFLFALSVAIGTIALMPGSNSDSGGILYPIAGPMRFFWPSAIIAVSTAIYFVHDARRRQRLVVAGVLAWVVGCLWSAESLIYCSCAWLPAVILARLVDSRKLRWFERARYVIRGLLENLGALGLCVIAIDLYYLVRIHHMPDWRGFVEVAYLYAGGLVGVDANPVGSIWFIVFALGALATMFVLCWRMKRLRALPVLGASFGAVWAVTSYYAMRSVDNNINAIFAIVMFAFAALLVVTVRERFTGGALRIAQAMILPVLIWGVSLSFANGQAWEWMTFPFSPAFRTNIADGGPAVDVANDTSFEGMPAGVTDHWTGATLDSRREALLRRNDVPLTSRILTWDKTTVGALPLLDSWRLSDGTFYEPTPWIPLAPPEEMAQLPAARRDLYVERHFERNVRHGWILSYAAPVNCDEAYTRAGTLLHDHDGLWYLTFCSADQGLSAPIQTAFELRAKDVRGTVDEFMVDGVVTSLPHDAPVVIAVGHQLTMRGWLIKTDGKAIRNRIAVRVDAGQPAALNYGSSRADVPATLAAAGIRGANAAVGYSGLVPTRDLAPGIHHLSLIIEGRSSRTEIIVARDIPFTVARLPHE